MLGRNPVKCTLHLTLASGKTAAGVGIICAVNFFDIAVVVCLHSGAFDNVGALQTHLGIGGEAEEFLGWILHEVVTFDVEFAGERHRVGSCLGVLRIVFHLNHFDLTLRIVCDNYLDGVDYSHTTSSDCIEIFTYGMFEKRNADHGLFDLGVTDAVDKVSD